MSYLSTPRGSAKIWDSRCGALHVSLGVPPHRAILSVCFSPSGRYVASASEGGEPLLWRTIDRSCIARASSIGSQVDHVAISPDGRGGVGTTLVWSDRQDDVRLSLEGSYRVCSQRLQMRQKVVEHVPIFI